MVHKLWVTYKMKALYKLRLMMKIRTRTGNSTDDKYEENVS